ncbi:DUF3870 domain-containing protein [Tepidibacter hydrothermalis]|uniref:DUF3870 domain-containing protein n=1 Tax=Tepidibacter hydrothermalis TaxID=3036126 RepID=A0ABY8EB14_9FIRM|nr:DUF3870 domain-containing protein [Tepidibacter hydrothermalis]WFD10115.1 DUF3870 domain-containing protein [Tepidibacter hydrothermalis]
MAAIKMSSNNIFITGYAKLPTGITAQELYTVVAIGLLINRENGTIVDLDCTLVTSTAKRFVRENLVGRKITNYDEIECIFNERYYGCAKKALLFALKICNEKFNEVKAN